ncbi:Hypothetical predicted protein [Mytilus galloprovincialis]|uniref:Uncharacterized protein n=1 Tax=Mytilus galloprovincialis TaxID=29158 RepID=A0A8B6CBZ0_MYTGA|nr:Hypothetical predicted protein [Mytilus galloprovincialis]
MMSIQLVLAVVMISAVYGSDSDKYYDRKPDNYGTKPDYYDTKPAYIDTQPECYKKDGYCEHYTCRKGYACDLKNSYGCPRDAKCCLPDESYNPYPINYGDRVEYQKPYGDRVEYQKPYGDRVEYQKPYGDRVEYQKPYGDNVDDYYRA